MTTFLQDEASSESGEPREGIEIQHGSTVYRIATGSRDVEINGNTFESQPGNRDEISATRIGPDEAILIRLPVSHELPQRWLGSLSAPRGLLATVYRYQVRSASYEVLWKGVLTTLKANGHIAELSGVTTPTPVLQRRLSTITTGRSCPHILYDAQCRVSRASFIVSTTVAGFNANTVTVASMGANPSHWAKYGELVHVASGDRMSISDQVGTLITMQLAIPDLRFGDAVQVFAGCDHSITDCSTKFANQVNYGGAPRAPKENPFIPGKRLGIIVQS